MRGERIVPQSEVIRAIFLEDMIPHGHLTDAEQRSCGDDEGHA